MSRSRGHGELVEPCRYSLSSPLTYKDSGVDIDAGDALVDAIQKHTQSTLRPEVISGIGGFAGLFELDLKKYSHPVLVSCTDGVGTKLKLAFEMNQFDTIGIDLVAMCVNDLICCGAEPLFFLDYYATGKLENSVAKKVIAGMCDALAKINCTLLGGETAEMPGFYQEKEFDLAGFAVGVVEKKKIIDGSKVNEGDVVIGLTSSGPHSNGYSLVRKIIEGQKLSLHSPLEKMSKKLGEILLEPTKIYVNPIRKILDKFNIRALAHITGGGLVENIPRVIPNGLATQIEKKKIDVPPIFSFLQKKGNVRDDEMWRVFNMGIGFVVVVPQDEGSEVIKKLEQLNVSATIIGSVIYQKNNKKIELI